MPLSKEELLVPRYKVVCDYPKSPFTVGQVLQLHNTDTEGWRYTWYEDDGRYSMWEVELASYPAIFQSLQWWEEREISGLPDYTKDENTSCIYRTKWRDNGGQQECSIHEPEMWLPIYMMKGGQPATESEYLSFIKQ